MTVWFLGLLKIQNKEAMSTNYLQMTELDLIVINLVTHQLHHLKEANHILALANGR